VTCVGVQSAPKNKSKEQGQACKTRTTMPYSAALLLALATGVQGHGAMVTPAPRNAIDR
jgi:hypothetical protein